MILNKEQHMVFMQYLVIISKDPYSPNQHEVHGVIRYLFELWDSRLYAEKTKNGWPDGYLDEFNEQFKRPKYWESNNEYNLCELKVFINSWTWNWLERVYKVFIRQYNLDILLDE